MLMMAIEQQIWSCRKSIRNTFFLIVEIFSSWNFYGIFGPIFHNFLISTLVTDEYPA
jgi:hypothetical protein